MRQPESDLLQHTRTASRPSDLRITDLRFAHVSASSMHCILLKIETNQGLVGMGEMRDGSSASYAGLLKSRLIGENPCDVDRLFRKIKQFGGPSRQGGGVSGVEIALWDLAGKAYGVPVYQMLGGKFRRRVELYCDQGRTPPEQCETGRKKGLALRQRMDRFGIRMCKAVLGVEDVQRRNPDKPVLIGPSRLLQELTGPRPAEQSQDLAAVEDKRFAREMDDPRYIPHPFTMLRVTDLGLDLYEEYLSQLREAVGWQTPLAIDHLGNLGLEDMTRLLRRMEKYNLLWAEDPLPWYMTQAYRALRQSTTTPLATGEDAYLLESFEPLCRQQAVSLIHPDVCSCGGILELKRLGNMAQSHGVAMACHMCETPVAALATAHAGLATENFVACEFNAPDDDYWQDLVTGLREPLIQDGAIAPSDKPGLGMDGFNDEVLLEHRWPGAPAPWESTQRWDHEVSYDRIWS